MTPVPTLYLRFVEREVIAPIGALAPVGASIDLHTVNTRTVRVLQQFWEHPNGGKDAVGDMFNLKAGTWRDVPLEREA
jgi:hypothetical protein